MDKETTPEDILEAIYVQIDEESEAIALKISGYDPENDDIGSKFNPRQVYYEQIKRHYKAGATPYGERLAAAEDLIEKIAGVLEDIINGARPANYEESQIWMHIAIGIVDQAMNDYQTYKQGKDGE